MDYYLKYIKYKTKYISLQSRNKLQKGGNNDELIKKIINLRISYLSPETREEDPNMTPKFKDFLRQLKAVAPSKEEQIKEIEAEVYDLESRIDESKQFVDPISGELDFTMSHEQIEKVIHTKLNELRQRGILVSKAEFDKEDKNNYHPQRSINLWRSMETINETMADVTRIFGADYLAKKFKEYGKGDVLVVPGYKLMVYDLSNIKVVVNCSETYGLVLYGVQGMLYADKIIGVPAMKEFADKAILALRAKKIYTEPAGKNIGLYPDPEGDCGKILLNTRWADYGIGLAGSIPWDNVIKSGDKYYFIDTELKSFSLLYKNDKFGEYLRERFALAHGRDDFQRKMDFYYTIT